MRELATALLDNQTITYAWTGTGFRFELAYTVTDLRTLMQLPDGPAENPGATSP